MTMARLSLVVLAVCMIGSVLGDCYMQNPRGNNDRYNEQTENRQNENRLFDSQNNAKGGYCWGPPMSFVEKSILPIEWTSQHGCGGPHVTCTEIIQYMCSDTKGDATNFIRDGTTTDTIPNDPNNYQQKNADGTYVYGMNENYNYYQDCTNRERNKGLFTADQNLNADSATRTRQNPGGTRHGFECVEERDYYPYWHPSPWKDVVVMVPTLDNCPFYQAESQNVKAKNYCSGGKNADNSVPNNEVGCVAGGGTWLSTPAYGIPAPDCKLASYSRDNHLGNAGTSDNTANYTWALPDASVEPCIATSSCNCVLRIRYNITTNESTGLTNQFIDATNNSILYDNPTVKVEGRDLTLALDTAQYGRTFQDRSYVFHISPRPAGVSMDTKIYNLNVRGKRGNIVQTFPATEYDFVPNRLTVNQGDIVHFQWTGCDNNPDNEGQGRARTDRSNIVQIKDLDNNIPVVATNDTVEKALFDSAYLRNRMALIDQDPANCKTTNDQNDIQNCAKLNAAPTPYFDGGLVTMNQTGKFTYMSTRNNNFSNRTQKGQLTVNEGDEAPKTSAGLVAGMVILSLVLVAAALGGLVFYGKKHPLSAVGRAVDKIRLPGSSSSSSSSNPRRVGLLGADHAN